MKVLFDARWIKPNKPDGITRFSRELIRELAQDKRLELALLVALEQQTEHLPNLPIIKTQLPTSPKELFLAKKLNPLGFEIVFSPHYLFGGKGRRFKLVLTVHDLTPFNYPDKSHDLTPKRLLWRTFYRSTDWLRRLLNQADMVVAVSQTTAQHLKDLTHKPVEVIYNAPITFDVTVHATKQLLYIGRDEPYKNVDLLAQAMRQLPDYKLVLAGQFSPHRQKELRTMANRNDQLNFIGFVDDKQYGEELARSFALVSASKAEGFGLPVIEAMQAGVPVIISDIEVFHEVANEAALYFPPDSVDQFVLCVKKLEQPALRKKFITQGKQRAADFSWAASARKLIELFSQLAA